MKSMFKALSLLAVVAVLFAACSDDGGNTNNGDASVVVTAATVTTIGCTDSTDCINNGTCNPTTGECTCPPGDTTNQCGFAFITTGGATVDPGTQVTCSNPTSTGESGFEPDWEDLPCVQQGVAYSQTFTLENFTSIVSGSTTVVVDSIKIYNVFNVPDGMEIHLSKTTLLSGETMCVEVRGTTNGPVGAYLLDFELELFTNIVDLPKSKIQEIIAAFETLLGPGGTDDIDFSYYVRVTAAGATCP